MITEEQIRDLAYTIWEQEGRPQGKDIKHYYRAKKILEERESSKVIELAPPATTLELEPAQRPVEITSPQPSVELSSPKLFKQRKNRKGKK
jgi:hypothetical protein